MISDGVDLFMKRIVQNAVDEPIDFKEVFGALTIDVIVQTMFGMHIDAQNKPNSKFIFHAKKLFDIPVLGPLFAVILIFPKLGALIHKLFPKWEIFGTETVEFFSSNLQRAIKEREKSSEQYNDFLALMLKAQKEKDSDQSENLDSKSLSHEELIAQCIIFLVAGYETTATTLTYAAYFLAKNPSAQHDLYGEILDTIANGGELTQESLANMPLLDSAISETLRMCPPLVRIDRVCTQDAVLTTSNNRKIVARKGDIFTIPIYAIHTDPSLWQDPEKFDVYRFTPENKKSHSPCSFLPFGLGPRNCVGMRFALIEAKWALVNLLKKFEIVPCAETIEKIKFRNTGFSSPENPILLRVIKRE